MEILQLVESYRARFAAEGVDNAKRVTEELLAHAFNCRPLEIYLHTAPLLAESKLRLELLAKRIENGEPLQYVVGHVDFRGLEIKCDSRALIPRPETELLVEEVLISTIWENNPASVVDIGTGTGCIALSLASERLAHRFTAVDISSKALDLAKENACAHGLQDRIVWKENNLLDGFPKKSCDAVVANLPYISSSDWKELSCSVRDFEPQSALDSGPSGMELITDLAEQARDVLIPGGMLFLEFGFDQGESVFKCLEKLCYTEIVIKHDLAGLDRMAIARNP